jgi:hypothetical protein
MGEIMYRVRCEWDIGLEYYIFKSLETAREETVKALLDCAIDDDLDELRDAGLVVFEYLYVK